MAGGVVKQMEGKEVSHPGAATEKAKTEQIKGIIFYPVDN